MLTSTTLTTKPSKDYSLLDSGSGEKLERFGDIVLSRPDPQALWHKNLTEAEWQKCDGYFTRDENNGGWALRKNVPTRWQIELGGLKLFVKPTAFKHVGVFPEQETNWQWLGDVIPMKMGIQDTGNTQIEVLNLFGYTGAATLACAKAGAKVVHVDGSKVALTWARDNAELSGLKDKPVRWILDDARDFVRREVKRGRKYHGIIMDPPAFGHGPNGELWKIEEDFLPLLADCMKILADKPLFFLINGYAAGYSSIAYENNLRQFTEKYGGSIERGELTIEESAARLLPCGIYARWSK